MVVNFAWPMKKAAALNFNSYYAISNYVDQDPTDGLLDYYCNDWTYDGHTGTDMYTWPFEWYLVENDLVEVIAAAPGTIVYRSDGNDDDHCECSGNWNSIFLQHADGSVSIYGHLKKNSVTSKIVGQTVATGEYLGIVASSGCSTGPHLHFEVYEDFPLNYTNLIDPYSGSCNSLNDASWWAAQEANLVPTLNALLTHSALPSFGCPGNMEDPKFKNSFSPGEQVWTAAYYRDELQGDVSTFRLRKPNGSVWETWSRNSNFTNNFSLYFWYWYLPTDGPFGTWTLEVDYHNQTFTHNFDYFDPDCTSPGNNIWVGPSVGTWHQSASYWSRGFVPKRCDNVIIPAGKQVTVLNGHTAVCNTLQVNGGSYLYVQPNAVMEVQNPE